MIAFEKIREAVAFLSTRGIDNAETGIVLGTGLGKLAGLIKDPVAIDYTDIPHFPISTVESHAGKLISGVFAGKRIIAMQGRMHFYEGYPMEQVAFPIRVMSMLGIKALLLSGAAGALNPLWKKGELMMLTDHINLLPDNPLRGPNDDRLGPRFPDMSQAYSAHLNGILREVAKDGEIPLREGVYASLAGPMLETPAEYRFLQRIGANAVGMSTVPEVIVAKHSALPCAAVVVLTDECDPDNLAPVNIQEIIAVAAKAEQKLIVLLEKTIERL